MATDNFTGTNGDYIHLRSGWSQALDYLTINNNRVRPAAAGGGFCGAVYSGEDFTDDHSSQLVTTVNGFRSIGPTVRANASTAACYFLRSRFNYEAVGLYEVDSGGTVSLLDAGDVEQGTRTWFISIEGGDITVNMGGSAYSAIAQPVNDTTISTGNAGIGGIGTDGGTADYGDDWEGLTVGGGGPTTTRGTPFGHRGTAFNGGRTFHGIIQ